MGVISQISVGDIMYYQVDNMPSHAAPKGSVAIMDSSSTYTNGFTYVNNDGGTTWLKCISPSYGSMSLTNATNTIDFDTQVLTPPSFFAFNGVPLSSVWTLNPNSSSDWILSTENTTTDDLKYIGSTTMRAFVNTALTVRGGTTRWLSHVITTSQNFAVVTTSLNQYYIPVGSATIGCGHNTIREVVTNDYFLGAISPVARQGGGGAAARSYIPRHFQITAIKIDEPLVTPISENTILSEDWESGGFTENSWTVVNHTTNVWVVGGAENNGGLLSAYISNNGGTSASYTITTANVSHFYKDVVIPTGTTTFSFDWKCQGENAAGVTQYDYGAVVITSTATTPVTGTEVITTQTAGAATTRIGATTNGGKFNLGYGTTPGTTWNTETINLSAYAGQTKRLVFTWVNDTSVGVNPPFVIDNILITNTVGGFITY